MEVRAGGDPVRVRAAGREIAVSVHRRGAGDREPRVQIEAVATADGRDFHEGYEVIEHRDLETRYLYHDAESRVRGVDVKIAPGLKVGYVMGVGDDVPAGIAQLGRRCSC